MSDGATDGMPEGMELGGSDGMDVGTSLGADDGMSEGAPDGVDEGMELGISEGLSVSGPPPGTLKVVCKPRLRSDWLLLLPFDAYDAAAAGNKRVCVSRNNRNLDVLAAHMLRRKRSSTELVFY